MTTTKQHLRHGRELDALLHEDDLREIEAPANGELYRYSCPVDHSGHMVSMRGWRCKDTLDKPALILIHDAGEDIRMYRDCARYICEQGFSCYGYDQRGHGQSTERIGHIESFGDLVQDLLQVASWVRHMHNGNCPILVGQGYGCLVACELLAKYPQAASAAVLSAPTIELNRKPDRFQRFAISLFAEIAPYLSLPKMLRPRFSNPKHRDYSETITTRIMASLIKANDLKVSASFARELLAAMDRFPSTFAKIRAKTLILRPEEDEVAKFDLIRTVVNEHVDPSLVTLKPVPGMHHNAFTENYDSMTIVTDTALNWVKTLDLNKARAERPL